MGGVCCGRLRPRGSIDRRYSLNTDRALRNPRESSRGKNHGTFNDNRKVESRMKIESQSRNPNLHVRIALGALACAVVALAGQARAADVNGWYTQEQAQRGQSYFNNYCAECHRPDLTGAAGPALVGDTFLKQWANKPLSDLFNFEHANMPATNPGSLPDDTMWTITAFILQKNGFPAGSVALNQQTGASRTLVK
ncbi:MAG TPA: cytochrome c [Burkholderiaceae bacterium]|jgi:mono/diheme cytochrome c family protein|nr:cytochrome c [Burkholderiaceae bacterium]